MTSRAPILPTSKADIAASVVSHQAHQAFSQNNVMGLEPSLEELRRQKRKRRTMTIVVGSGMYARMWTSSCCCV